MENTKQAPWTRQRSLKREHVPPYTTIVRIAEGCKDEIARALFIICYLTGGRITEILPCPYLKKNIYETEERIDAKGNSKIVVSRNANGSPIYNSYERVEINYPGVLRKDIIEEERGGHTFLVFRMANRKNRRLHVKNVPTPIQKESELYKLLQGYINKLAPDDPIVPYKVGWARKVLGKLGFNPHYLRSVRLTHLAVRYNFTALQLQKFAGWTTIDPAINYVQMAYSDLTSKFYE